MIPSRSWASPLGSRSKGSRWPQSKGRAFPRVPLRRETDEVRRAGNSIVSLSLGHRRRGGESELSCFFELPLPVGRGSSRSQNVLQRVGEDHPRVSTYSALPWNRSDETRPSR